MRPLLPIALLALAAAPLAATSLPNQKTEETAVDLEAARATLARLAKRLEKASTIAGTYRQERTTPLLKRPLIATGRILLRRDPACLVLHVEKPRAAIVRSDARTHLNWRAGKKRAERFEFPENERVSTLLRCLTGDVKDLEKAFEITAFAKRDDADALELRPRDAKLREDLPYLALEIGANGDPRAVTTTDGRGETVRIALADLRLDPESGTSDADFDRPLPDDVEVVTRRLESESAD